VTRREKLIDNYEDALFAVLMDKVAEEEGAKLREENQRLQNDPAAEVPEHVDAVARQTIRKAFAGQNRRSALHVARRVLNTVAMIVLICSAIFATAYAAFPEVRVKTLNLLIQSSDVASRLVLDNEKSSSLADISEESIMLYGYELPRLSGFSVIDKQEDKHGAWIEYSNNENAKIRIDIAKGGTKYVDTEEASTVKELDINGNAGMMVIKGNRIMITWSEAEHGVYITLVCTNLGSNVALSVAEQINFED
jgi:hypothetical protein